MVFKPIRKKPISLNNLISFEKINIDKLETLLNDVISHYTYNTFDLLKLVMSNYDGNLKEAITRIDDYSDVRFNCYYACRLLKEKLSDIGLKSYLISESMIFILILQSNIIRLQIVLEEHYIFSSPKYSFIKFIANFICGLIHLFL